MNGQLAKHLRKIAKTIGRDPQYIKKNYKRMTPFQKTAYREFTHTLLSQSQLGKGVANGQNLPALRKTDSAASQ